MHSLPSLAMGMIVALVACAPTGPAAPRIADADRAVGDPAAVRPKGTLRLAWPLEPDTLGSRFLTGAGAGEYQWLFNSPLTYRNMGGVAHPLLAAQIPTQANGSWVIHPDGTMVTTYKLRPNARWHDGVSITGHDYVFANDVYIDKEMPVVNPGLESLIEGVVAADDFTLVIRWKEPYANATVIGYQQLIPLPSHQIEEKYRTNKAGLMTGDEWTTAYIGAGPFKVERWNRGVGMVARAHMDFALGPPKLETLDIRFIVDRNAQVANLLSGEVDMINAPGVRAEEAVIARDQWAGSGEGWIKAWATRTSYLQWQFREVPNWQKAVNDIRVRQALLHAIDRDGLAEVINLGFGGAAHAFVNPDDPIFPDVDRAITKYGFDVNRANALMEESGWRRSPGGGLAANAAGQSLAMDLWTTQAQERQNTIVVDNWKTAGVDSRLTVIPLARARDNEFRASFPGVDTVGRTIGPENFVWTAAELPTPENSWSGSNRGSFYDAEIDRLQRLRISALEESERRQATIAQLKRMTEVVGPAPYIYSIEVILARKSVVGPVGNYGPQEGITWNVHEWEVAR